MDSNILPGLLVLGASLVILISLTCISVSRIEKISKRNIRSLRDFINERKSS